jgi:hypothetical protein
MLPRKESISPSPLSLNEEGPPAKADLTLSDED